MALSRRYKKGHILASSLIESVIAITIIATCLMVALKLYITILDGRPSINNHRLKYQVDKLFSEMKLNPNFNSQVYDLKTHKIKKTVTDYVNRPGLKKISYTVQGQSDTITYHYLLLKDEEN